MVSRSLTGLLGASMQKQQTQLPASEVAFICFQFQIIFGRRPTLPDQRINLQKYPMQPSPPIPPGTLKIVCISDTNNTHQGLESLSGDILIHCGDFTKSGTENEFYTFINFLSQLKFKHKVVIAGHKDMTFDTERYQSHLRRIFHTDFPEYDGEVYKSELQSLENVYYLQHQMVEVEGVRIWGSPYQPMFFDCAFGREDHERTEIWGKVNDKMDILVTHCPPYGVMDQYKGTNTGCKVILDKVKQLKPKYHVFGHNRDCHGTQEIDGTTFVSCCRFDSKFKPINDAIVITYPAPPS